MTALLSDLHVCERRAPSQTATRAMVRWLHLGRPQAVGLETLVENAALMHRVDRKYIAPLQVVRDLIDAVGDTHRVLRINGRRYTTYRTTYFDTEEFASARAHIQGRRRRWKVRSRLYVEDDLSRVEVKTKDNRGNTIKVMGTSHPDLYGTLVGDDRDFVATHLSDFSDANVTDLVPAAEVRYTRATLTDLSAGTRVTIDLGLSMHLSTGGVWLDEQFAMVETKGPLALSRVDKTLLELGVRPRCFSKYVAGASMVTPGIPSNDFASLQARRILHSNAMAV